MCGICGFIDFEGLAGDEKCISRMAARLRHRGPDDFGTWSDRGSGIALGHTRLSIVDLSPEGHQPMRSASGRFTIVFNGEIYNFQELATILRMRGHKFRGHSDTEVMLAAFEEWGIENALKLFNGMFALGVWDATTRTLTLARDRLGEKPLYYGWQHNTFLFGSELKALRAHPAFDTTVDRSVLALFMAFSYVPAPYSIYQTIRKLPAGTFLTLPVSPEETRRRTLFAPERYWNIYDVRAKGIAEPFDGSDQEAQQQLECLLLDAVRIRMLADVPLGAFLSGGVDSSLTVALMQGQSSTPVRTFSIGFSEQEYNESAFAAGVARHLGTQHTELRVTPGEALAVIPRLSELYDEPFADSSQVPTFLLSALTRKHVTVSLSGDGGDELFMGYPRYFWAVDLWKMSRFIPRRLDFLSGLLARLPLRTWRGAARVAQFVRGHPMQRLDHRIRRALGVLHARSPSELYRSMVTHWGDPFHLVKGSGPLQHHIADPATWEDPRGFLRQMMFADIVAYLPDDILVKVDRAAMGVALETRIPFLDPRVVEFSYTLPTEYFVRHGVDKWILRQILYRYVPRDLVERPKMGFGIPIEYWLKGELRPWAEALLDERRIEQEGYFESAPIREKWREFVSDAGSWDPLLWDVLMFQAWLEHTQATDL